MRNASQELPFETTAKHLSNFCQRMRASGYNETTDCKSSRLECQGQRWRGAEDGQSNNQDLGMRTTDRRRTPRQTFVQERRSDVPLFVSCTPIGELSRRVAKVEEMKNQGRTIMFKVVEKLCSWLPINDAQICRTLYLSQAAKHAIVTSSESRCDQVLSLINHTNFTRSSKKIQILSVSIRFIM